MRPFAARAFTILGALAACAALVSCASLAERRDDLANRTREAVDRGRDLSSVPGEYRALVDRAKRDPEDGYFALASLEDWIGFHLSRGELEEALPLLREADGLDYRGGWRSDPKLLRELLWAVAELQRGNPDASLARIAKAWGMKSPGGGDDPVDDYVPAYEAYVLQSLGRYKEATAAASKGIGKSRFCRDLVLWNSLSDGPVSKAFELWDPLYGSPLGALARFEAELAYSGPEGAQYGASLWLKYANAGTRLGREDWLEGEGSMYGDCWAFYIADYEKFFRVPITDQAKLRALAAYSYALGKQEAFPQDLPQYPFEPEEAFAAKDPYAVDYAVAEAIWEERRGLLKADKVEALFASALGRGMPKLAVGTAACVERLARLKRWDEAESLLKKGYEAYPGDWAPLAVSEALLAARKPGRVYSTGVIAEAEDMPMSLLERDKLAVSFAFWVSQDEEHKRDLPRYRDSWLKKYPESASRPFWEALEAIAQHDESMEKTLKAFADSVYAAISGSGWDRQLGAEERYELVLYGLFMELLGDDRYSVYAPFRR